MAACGSTKTHRVVTGQPGAAHAGDVALYMAGSPTPPLDEVAIVQAVGQGAHADLEHVVQGLKKEAGQLGCTVLANVKIDQRSGTASGTAICARLRPNVPAREAAPPSPSVTPSTPAERDSDGSTPTAEGADAGS